MVDAMAMKVGGSVGGGATPRLTSVECRAIGGWGTSETGKGVEEWAGRMEHTSKILW